ncbi:hypothetical protein [Clostridium disporicum]|uniref:hypothetical protein n=1 Tax=Clostridium disporicum TaxID=84024 RepID=UPI0006C2506D|nr:hypothetical protein [Clostridium disporicum]CUN36289.1 Uncharacterised protein [Clostridium disporicum]
MEKIYMALYEGGLGEELANGLISKLKEGVLWIGDKILGGLGAGLIGLTPVFAGACMIGVFITIAGEKKLGTKISSLSIVIYFLLKVILGA